MAKGDWHDASRATVKRIGAVISASAATVIVGLGAMAFGDFGMIQTTGPALAVGIFVTLVAGLTLAPALLGIFGHYLFWPLHTRTAEEGEPGGFFARLADAVSRRPGVVTAVLLVVLLIPFLAIPSMKTNFDVLAELPADSDARAGFEVVTEHMGKGNVFQSTGIIVERVERRPPASRPRSPGSWPRCRSSRATDGRLARHEPRDARRRRGAPRRVPPVGASSARWPIRSTGDSGGTTADSAALLDPDVSDGLATATTYLALLGDAYPDVAAGSEYRAATAGLADAQDSRRAGPRVRGRLDAAPRARIRDDLADGRRRRRLRERHRVDRDDRRLPRRARGGLPRGEGARPRSTTPRRPSPASRRTSRSGRPLDLSDALEALATHFDDRPDATLIPESLSGTAAAKEARRRAEATFEQLPVDLRALSAVLAARSDDIFLPLGIGGDEGADVAAAVDAFVSADRSATRFFVTTTEDPYSEAGFAAVAPGPGRPRRRGTAASARGATAHLGGTTAQFADVKSVLGSDMQRVGVITVLGILLVLMLLLRAVVAPLYLVATVLLSYGTALGLSSWLFESVLGHAGISFYLPILMFVLLVSLGSDYNIFLMSRVREESEGRPIRDGIRIASGRTGAVITSAGLILAGTFGSMATAPLVILFQVGVAVALGVLIDTFLVRSILVPAITTLFGERAWWPSGQRPRAARLAGRRDGPAAGRRPGRHVAPAPRASRSRSSPSSRCSSPASSSGRSRIARRTCPG